MSNSKNRARMGAQTAAAKAATAAATEVAPVVETAEVSPAVVEETPAVTVEAVAPVVEETPVTTEAIEQPETTVRATVPSLFAQVLKLAEGEASDVLHAKNLIDNVDALLGIKKGLLTNVDYQLAGKQLLSSIRSLNTVSDKVFIAALPVILDLFEDLRKDGDRMFTDEILPFNIFGNSVELRGLNAGHPQFITVLGALADKSTRNKVGKSIDIEANFAVLTDSKRTLVKSLFR